MPSNHMPVLPSPAAYPPTSGASIPCAVVFHGIALQIALKAADLSHLSDPIEGHLKWVAALEEEFFRQGDAEKEAGLTVTPLFDRSKPGVFKSQVAFMDIVVVPLFQAMAGHFPATESFLTGVRLWLESPVK
jgi:hypothetical protein